MTKERAFYSYIKKSSYRRGAVLDDVEGKLVALQHQFGSRRGVSFLFNPNASRGLEQFANNFAVNAEIQKSLNDNFNKNALVQIEEIDDIFNVQIDENKVSVISGFDQRGSRLSTVERRESASTRSLTMQRQQKMRKSVVATNKIRHKKRSTTSIARASLFRACEPAIQLDHDQVSAQNEAIRRGTAMNKSRASVFMMR